MFNKYSNNLLEFYRIFVRPLVITEIDMRNLDICNSEKCFEMQNTRRRCHEESMWE